MTNADTMSANGIPDIYIAPDTYGEPEPGSLIAHPGAVGTIGNPCTVEDGLKLHKESPERLIRTLPGVYRGDMLHFDALDPNISLRIAAEVPGFSTFDAAFQRKPFNISGNNPGSFDISGIVFANGANHGLFNLQSARLVSLTNCGFYNNWRELDYTNLAAISFQACEMVNLSNPFIFGACQRRPLLFSGIQNGDDQTCSRNFIVTGAWIRVDGFMSGSGNRQAIAPMYRASDGRIIDSRVMYGGWVKTCGEVKHVSEMTYIPQNGVSIIGSDRPCLEGDANINIQRTWVSVVGGDANPCADGQGIRITTGTGNEYDYRGCTLQDVTIDVPAKWGKALNLSTSQGDPNRETQNHLKGVHLVTDSATHTRISKDWQGKETLMQPSSGSPPTAFANQAALNAALTRSNWSA